MDRFSKLVAAAFFIVGSNSVSAFVFPSPPPGFGGAPGQWTYAPPSGSEQVNKIIHQSKVLNVSVPGAGKVAMDVGFKLGPAARRAAGTAIFLHPAIRIASGISMWLGAAKIVWDEVEKVWKTQGDSGELSTSDGWQWGVAGGGSYPSKSQACKAVYPSGANAGKATTNADGTGPLVDGFMLGGVVQGDFCVTAAQYGSRVVQERFKTQLERRSPSSCPAGWYVTPAGCVQTPPPSTVETLEEFLEKLLPNPMPKTVPGELPYPTPLPIEQPSPWINPQTDTPTPTHRPMFVPTGDPVANPQYDPTKPISPDNQPFIQPGVRLNPSPTVNDPFRIDVKPINRPKEDGSPSPDPVPENPPDTPGQMKPGDEAKPEDPPGLCDLYPDILACVKLDKPDSPDIPQSQKEINITPDSGWGADGGTCPPPRQIMVQGRQIPIPFDLFCTYMDGIRPIIIAMAWLSAAFIILGARE